MAPTTSVLTLDDARILTPGGSIDARAEVVFASALYLALESPRLVSRKVLRQLLWPDTAPALSSHRLRQTLLKLRQTGFPVQTVGRDHLKVAPDVLQFDYDTIETLTVPQLCTVKEIFAGGVGRLSWGYSEWLDAQRTKIASHVTNRLLRELGWARTKGIWPSVESLARAVLNHSPENEEATLALAESMAMRGEKSRATRLLDAYTTSVGAESGELRISSSILKRRITQRMPPPLREIGAETPLYGRHSDLERLVLLLSDVVNGQPKFALISGDVGIGKSRLLNEFLSFSSLDGAVWQRVACRSTDSARPLALFLELIPLIRAMRGAIGSAPETLDFFDALTIHRPSGLAKTSSRAADFPTTALDVALLDILDAVTEEAVVVIAIEDCQWIDSASAEVLRRLTSNLNRQRVFLLMTTRNNEAPAAINRSSGFEEIELSGLDAEAARSIIASVVLERGKILDPDYVDWCVSVAEGNPFFLHELANEWIESGERHPSLPSLTSVLKQRLARLQPNALQVLQACAVLENHSSMENLESLLGYPAHELLHCINELALCGMLAVSNGEGKGFRAGRLNSKHDLLSETALSALSPPARAYLHRRAAKVLETRIDQSGDASTLWSCAKHWQLAGDAGQAFRLAVSCANHLLEVGLPQDAAEAFARASRYCATDADRLGILESEATCHFRSSNWKLVTSAVEAARALKARIDPQTNHHDDLELMQLRADWTTLRWDQILSRSIDCLNASEASNPHRLEAGVMALMMLSFRDQGDEAARVFAAISRVSSEPETAGGMLHAKMIYHTNWGSFGEATAAATELIDFRRKGNDVGALFQTLCNASVTFRAACRLTESRQFLLDALGIANQHRLQLSKSRALPMLAHMSLEQGDVEDARRWLHELESIQTPFTDPIGQVEISTIRARLALGDGRLREAKLIVENDLAQMRSDPNPHRRVYGAALKVVAELNLKSKASLKAVRDLEEAHLLSRRNVFQAFAAYALYAGLKSRGERARAETLLEEYLTKFRREPCAPPKALVDSMIALVPRQLMA